jgi:predicted nucleotidyltransferase
MNKHEEIDTILTEITSYLKDKGCRKIVLFGSYAEGDSSKHSDIDIAIKGMSSEDFFKAVARLSYIVKKQVDLVDLDDIQSSFRNSIEKEGKVLYAG